MVTIEGSANSTLAGKLHVTGQWQRLSKELNLSLKADQISLASLMTDCLEKLWPVIDHKPTGCRRRRNCHDVAP